MTRTRIAMMHGVKCGGHIAADISAKASVAAELPSEVSKLLNRLALAPPPKGYAIPTAVVNASIEGRPISERLEIKALLRQHRVIN